MRLDINKHRMLLALDVVDEKLVHASAVGVEAVRVIEWILTQQFLGPYTHNIFYLCLSFVVDIEVVHLWFTAAFQCQTIDIHKVGVCNEKLHRDFLAIKNKCVVVAAVQGRAHRG